MDSRELAKDAAKVLQNYLTYQAVKNIIDQLSETNPGQAIWLRQYSSGGKLQDGEAYLEELMRERQGKELVVRIMTVREAICDRVSEFLPEMVSSNIKQANLKHRRQLLERLTQSQPDSSPSSDRSNLESDANEPAD